MAAAGLDGLTWPRLHPEDEAAVINALRDDYWGGIGDEKLPHRIFEKEYSRYHDAKYGITVANGTLSLELSLKVGGIKPGDEVLVPAITFVASATAIVSVGAIPVFVDVDPETCQISAEAIKAAITPKTRGIIIVHYSGYMADLDAILPIATEHNLIVVEDCAHAQGSAWRGKKAGSWGTLGSFSFQHSKSLSSGEGGIVITSNEELYEKAILLMNLGRRQGQRHYNHYISASNWRLGGLQAALLLSQFGKFPREAEERHKNVTFFTDELNKIPGVKALKKDDRITQKGCYFLLIDFDEKEFGCSRQKFVEALNAEGVRRVFCGYERPLYKEPAFLEENLRPLLHESIHIPDYAGMNLPNAERWASRQVTLLHLYFLGDSTNAKLVLEAIHKVKENVGELA